MRESASHHSLIVQLKNLGLAIKRRKRKLETEREHLRSLELEIEQMEKQHHDMLVQIGGNMIEVIERKER